MSCLACERCCHHTLGEVIGAAIVTVLTDEGIWRKARRHGRAFRGALGGLRAAYRQELAK
jgi:hypothetical protein